MSNNNKHNYSNELGFERLLATDLFRAGPDQSVVAAVGSNRRTLTKQKADSSDAMC